MALWTSPAALGLTVERTLRDASSSGDLLPEGWILQLIEEGHSWDRLPAFIDAMLQAGMRVATSNTFATLPTVDAYLRDLHAQHDRAGTSSRGGVCGYMFKNNDIAWNCRTCQMDDTCVQCQPCFQNSDHTGHEVFFHRTSPGGMCDCGDVEAWKPEGFCKVHTGTSPASASNELLLPPAFDRVVQCILHDFVGFMTNVAQRSINSFDDFKVAEKGEAMKRAHTAKLADNSQPATTTNPAIFHTRISNDDVHTDDELVRCLVGKGFSEGFAAEFTHSVDKRGCGMLKSDVTLAEALNWMRQMKEHGNWFASVVDNTHLAHECAWETLFACLAPLLAASSAVQSVLFENLFAPYRASTTNVYEIPAHKVPLAILLQATPFLKKELVKGMKQVYLALMGSKHQKTRFASLYVTAFPRLMMQYCGGMGTERENVFGLSVQLFTTPSIVHELETRVGLWEVVLSTLQDALSLAKVPLSPPATATTPPSPLPPSSTDAFTYDVKHMAIKYRRYFPLLQDINHLLMLPTMATTFASTHASLFLAVLADASHMNMQTRVPEWRPHVEREDNAAWISAFTLAMHLDSLVLPNVYKSLRMSNPDHVTGVLWELFGAFSAAWRSFRGTARLSFKPHAGLGAPIVAYSVASQPVSFHYPLHQAWGRFVLELLQRNLFPELKARVTADNLVDTLMEFPLRCLVWSSQIASNMWVRNGKDMMVRQVTSYYSLSSNHSFRDLDLVTVQTCLALCGAKKLLAVYLDRYDLLPFLTGQTADTWLHKVSTEKRAMYVSECLLKLIWIATELPPVPTQSIAAYLRRDVLHMILIKPHVFSHLRDQTNPVYCNPGLELTSDDAKNRELMALLTEIADIQPGSNQDMAPAKFTLKPQFYHEYDPAYFHVSPVHHVEAQVARQDVVFKTWKPDRDAAIPIVGQLPPGHPDLVVCRSILMEPDVFGLIRLCLTDPRLQTDENVFARVLHILTVQLYMVQEEVEDTWATVVREQISRAGDGSDIDDGGAKRQKTQEAASGILACLANRVDRYKSDESTQKPLWSATLFVLKGYLKMERAHMTGVVATYLTTHVFPTRDEAATTPTTTTLDATARIALQKKRQHEAMAKMMARQSNFAAQLDEDDMDDMDDATNADGLVPPPECNICAHVKKDDDDPIVYVALLQESTLRGRSVGRTVNRLQWESLHVQLCRHAVHLSCMNKYSSTVRREASVSAQAQIAFEPQAGEFLCPLCKSLCNTCVPYVPSPPTLAAGMERYFHHANDMDEITTWLTHALPEHMRTYFSVDGSVPAGGSRKTPAAIEMFLGVAGVLKPPSLLHGVVRGWLDQVTMLLRTASNMFHLGHLHGMSAAFCHLDLTSDSNSPLPPLSTRLASAFPPDIDALVDPFTAQDDSKLHAVTMMLSHVRDVFPIYASSNHDGHGVDVLFRTDTTPTTRDAYFLHMPLLEQDLFTLLLLVISGLQDTSDMLWAIRTFCSLHLVQVILQCMRPLDIPHDIAAIDEDAAVPETSPYAALRAYLVALSAGHVSTSPAAPSGALLHYLVEANYTEFLRKATLLARALFRGWTNTDAAAQYLNFVSNLHITTDLSQLCTQLGVPSPSSLLTDQSWWSGPIAHYIPQVDMDKLPPLSFLVKQNAVWAAHVPVVALAPLYTDLYTSTAASAVCPTTGLVQEAPAICLVCGAVVCGGSDCCKPNLRGACSQHVVACNMGHGAFFLTKQCQMLLVSSGGRASFFASPYVDEFGEEDHHVRRGRPLFLRPKRYMALMHLVWSHGIATEVSKNRRTSEQYIRPYFY
ncbi:hypothetical protein DYB37_001270 [Aphanomyces astaci]|uniref:E3 ubiquitin-protein ligase n=3 Tax=Aphanomyces astaci TaxID=112090 RepID=A0A3R7BC53_APHAT|nr:hypothetical protein DYB35_002637 [Aphanomyces astaci]RHZ12397.1 hypothetical protein DYB37_001270 [Aphanomyces astaci]